MDTLGGPAPAAGSAILAPPRLSFTDTGLSVNDGVTRTGLWDVSSSEGLGPGPLTFWIQQTGQLATRYALLLSIEPGS